MADAFRAEFERGRPGALPHLLDHLWTAFKQYLAEEIKSRAAVGKESIPLEDAITKIKALNFVTWATHYLNENRVVENFYLDSNHGIRLANNVALSICPDLDVRGTMQNAATIGVTEGKGRPENEGVTDTSSMGI